MLWSEIGIVTLREEQHPLLVRAAYMRGREYLFLGQRSLAKINLVLAEENDRGRALTRCGVAYIQAGADFVAESEAGGEILARSNDYAALASKAVSLPQPPAVSDPEGEFTPEEFSTPGVKTIAQIAEFTGLPATSQIKSLVMVIDGSPLLVLLRGDHQLSSGKLPGARAAEAEEIRRWFGADPGSLGPFRTPGGPIGTPSLRVIADEALRGRRNMIAGANKTGYHLRNVTPVKDFDAEFVDVRHVVEGDRSISLPIAAGGAIGGGGPLRFSKVNLLDTAERILSAAAEQNRDGDGLVLPAAIAPFTVVITSVHPDRLAAAREVHDRLAADGVDVLLDDRDARPGVKFKDADLIGIPYRITVGKKLVDGLVELIERRSHTSTDVPAKEISIPH